MHTLLGFIHYCIKDIRDIENYTPPTQQPKLTFQILFCFAISITVCCGLVRRPHQHGEVHWGKCSHTGTKLHTDVLVQSDLGLGLTLHHHPGQQHRYMTLSMASSETSKQGLVERRPANRGDGLLDIFTHYLNT